MGTTFRQDLHGHVLGLLGALAAAEPDKLRFYWHARPATLAGELPGAYIDELRETWTHDSGTRTREITGSVVFYDALADNAETDDRLNVLVDLFCELCTAGVHIALGDGSHNAIFRATGTRDVEPRQGPVGFGGVAVDFAATIQEGRS